MKLDFCTIIVILLAAALLFTGCKEPSGNYSLPKSDMPVTLFQGFEIPLFPTARGQLNYARSGFPDAQMKRAAFNLIFDRFPNDKAECGSAALNLAYMHFGRDYRFATDSDCLRAINDYHTVIKRFSDAPDVLVKAYWYLGWIHCELLGDTEKGLPYFRHIVKTYPELAMGISPPVPWVSLVYPLTMDGDRPKIKRLEKKWAALALLEIIRFSPEKQDVLRAFDMLWQKYQKSVAAGLAIELMLGRPVFAQETLEYVDSYLALNVANPYLSREIEEKARELSR